MVEGEEVDVDVDVDDSQQLLAALPEDRDRIEHNSENEPRHRQRRRQRLRRRNKCARFINKSKIMFSLCYRSLLPLSFLPAFSERENCSRGGDAPAGRTTAQNSSNDPQSVSKTSHTRCKTEGVIIIGTFCQNHIIIYFTEVYFFYLI